MWSDADWAGDPEDTKSTFGFLLELISTNNGRRWLFIWAVRRQGSTSNSTAEAETVALCYAVKREGLPMLILLDSARRRQTPSGINWESRQHSGNHRRT